MAEPEPKKSLKEAVSEKEKSESDDDSDDSPIVKKDKVTFKQGGLRLS